MKVALVCTGLGKVWRGYERYTADLFQLVRNDIDVTLFKGGGGTFPQEKRFFHLDHNGVASWLPSMGRDRFFYQLLSYSASLIPYLSLNRYSIVHYSEAGLGNILNFVKKKLGLRFRLLFSNGVGLPPEHCLPADHLHQLTDLYYEEAIRYGRIADSVSCLPYGFYGEKFMPRPDKLSLRTKYLIPADKVVVLAVSALNRTHKRIDYLIREVAELDQSFFLVVCGNMEDRSLEALANKLLPGRYRFIQIPFESVPELYHLSDIFVHTALEEGFCLALVEAMCAKLPILAHNAPHFKWLTDGEDGLIDMSRPGTLSQQLKKTVSFLPRMELILEARQKRVLERFDWKNLKQQYLAMYQRVSVS